MQMENKQCKLRLVEFSTLVEPSYISCKNLAEVEHIRYYLQKPCKYLTIQTKPVRLW